MPLASSPLAFSGWVAEWSKAAVLKTAVRETVPGVRIPPHPLLARERLSSSLPRRPATVAYQHLRLTDQGEVLVVSFQAGSLIDQVMIEQIGKELLDAALEASGNRMLLVNFHGVKFMSSSMLGQLMPLYKRCKADKVKLKFCNISPNLMEVFQITKLNKLFDICGSEADAVAAFGKRGFFG